MAERTGRPFYWTAPSWPWASVAPSGWYQWQRKGLVYLGPSMLEEATFDKQEIVGAAANAGRDENG